MNRKDLTREQLYESVKSLIDSPDKHIHLCQQKLYTLFSIAFQYLLYQSSKNNGAYIIRVEDSFLAEKLARKAKDETSRKFMARLLHTRKLRYERSTFYLDYFNLQSWSLTSDLPKSRLKAALIVKNTSNNPLIEETDFRFQTEADSAEVNFPLKELGEHYYLKTLMDLVPHTLTVAYGAKFDELSPMKFDFIPEPDEFSHGVKISSDVRFDED